MIFHFTSEVRCTYIFDIQVLSLGLGHDIDHLNGLSVSTSNLNNNNNK